ncbi:hypothetical protein [Massilia litorea]|uniref:Lipoprotein n=1 Tax=Massilia litorea TaxID=2769491 RepID=A0A7L9U238_9BURK|nr:hypothetical protein [Massilia litorea]QOL48265.1 hypothetical protein LPB04_14865 [Massilia litorea]
MKVSTLALGILAACMTLAGCDRGHANPKDGVIQTKFPGQVTAGGGTSGQVMARSSKPETNAAYAGGTPGIAGGSGGTTGGAAMGGTVTETGQGPSSGVTAPVSGGAPGNKPAGDYGTKAANAPAAGVTPVGAGSATNQDSTPAAAPGTLTGEKK